jgi:hypothetical protein
LLLLLWGLFEIFLLYNTAMTLFLFLFVDHHMADGLWSGNNLIRNLIIVGGGGGGVGGTVAAIFQW